MNGSGPESRYAAAEYIAGSKKEAKIAAACMRALFMHVTMPAKLWC